LDIIKKQQNHSETLPTRDGFGEVSLQGGELCADSRKPRNTEGPSSFGREVNEKCLVGSDTGSIYNPDPNSTDREIEKDDIRNSNTETVYSLSTNPTRATTVWWQGFKEGPFLGLNTPYSKSGGAHFVSDAPANEQSQPRKISPNSKRTLQKTPFNMVEHDRAQRRQGLALCGYILITTTIAIATVAFSLAVIAIVEINKLGVPTATMTFPNGRNESGTSGSGLQPTHFSTLAPSSALD
jgi:hypothetical protein